MTKAQDGQNDTIKTISIYALKQCLDEPTMKIDGYGERMAAMQWKALFSN